MTPRQGTPDGFDWHQFKSDVWSADEIGDWIEGDVIDLAVRDGRSGRVPVITLRCDDGSTRAVWCGAVDLRTKIADLAPQVGDRLRITYAGDQHVGQPSPMKLFTVELVDSDKAGELTDESEQFGEEPF
jgi:hypothetical protein